MQIRNASFDRKTEKCSRSESCVILSLETFEPPLAPKPVLFERYDSKTDSWESLTHFAYSRERSNMQIADSNTWHQVDISRKEVYYSAF
ncbi:hypothetical protein EV1_038590 [Malus domestica]